MVVKNVKNHQQWDLKDPQIIYIYMVDRVRYLYTNAACPDTQFFGSRHRPRTPPKEAGVTGRGGQPLFCEKVVTK